MDEEMKELIKWCCKNKVRQSSFNDLYWMRGTLKTGAVTVTLDQLIELFKKER